MTVVFYGEIGEKKGKKGEERGSIRKCHLKMWYLCHCKQGEGIRVRKWYRPSLSYIPANYEISPCKLMVTSLQSDGYIPANSASSLCYIYNFYIVTFLNFYIFQSLWQ